MAEFPTELQEKIRRVLGIRPEALKEYDPAEIVDQLCETVIMLDEENVLAQLTSLRDKLTAINGRIWNLLGKHDLKRARENLSGITELERYVGELKRRAKEKSAPAPPPPPQPGEPAEGKHEECQKRLGELEKRVSEIQTDLQNLVHVAMEIEEVGEEARSVLAKVGATLAPAKSEQKEKNPSQ